jgi:hypothetical protein
MTTELEKANADLAWWQGVFLHMEGWKVVGWSYRDSVLVVDEKGHSHSYTFEDLRPLFVAMGSRLNGELIK